MNKVKRVLIIDDDDDDCLIIKERLADFVHPECEFQTCCAKNEAVNRLRVTRFDLCILDHSLGAYDGLELLDEVADFTVSTPIVMLTGQNDDLIARKAIQKGAQDFVMKAAIDEDIFEKSIRYAISRKELEFSRLNTRRIAAENESKDKFIAHLSHELRTPLTSILGYTSLLLEKDIAAPLSKELNIIANNGKHLLNLLNAVLDLSKIVAGKFELKEQTTDLQTLLSDVNSLLGVAAIDKGLSLVFSASTKLPRRIVADDTRLRQVLVNLISNAIKFTDRGEVNIDVRMSDNKRSIIFDVKDSGRGIADDQIKQIFAPFKQLEDVSKRRAGGAGLGLSISKEIVNQMGGELQVDSVLDEGSTFSLCIPASYNGEEPLVDYDFHAQSSQVLSYQAPHLDGKILVVDDIYEIRNLAGHFIRQTGAHVGFAKNGKEALQMITEKQSEKDTFDLILLDLHMPIMTGIETVKALRNAGNMTKVIAMTAATQKGLQTELLSIGFDSILTKPIDKQTLWSLLVESLKVKSSQNQNLDTIQDLREMEKPYQDVCQDDHIESDAFTKSINKESGPYVHLIEDDIDSAQIMKILIKRLGFEVIHSANGREAIANVNALPNAEYYLIDLGLPDMSGDHLLKKLGSLVCSGRKVILSGREPEDEFLQRHEITDYICKPVSFDVLQKHLLR